MVENVRYPSTELRKLLLAESGVKFQSVIWDWNGTLLNDVDLAVGVINQLLDDRNLAQITFERYLEVFTFPVRDYYEKIGFDFISEPFEVPANQFITRYNSVVEACTLHDDVIPLLSHLQHQGCRQFILSAMEQMQLEKTVQSCGITLFFEELCGLNNHFASSKIEIGKLLIESKGLIPDQTLLIGDTIHDYEVAKAIGCSCLLIANGHQSRQRLAGTGAKVLESLNEIKLLLE